MKKLVLILSFVLCFSVEARKYTGVIDAGSAPFSTTYQPVLTNTKGVNGIACMHTTNADLGFSINGSETDCSDAPVEPDWEIDIAGKGTFAFDFTDVGYQICVKTLSGTANSGKVRCRTWLEGAAQ